MASGDTLVVLLPTDNEPPGSAYATFDVRNGHPVLDFDDTADEACVFSFILPRSYGGGGLTVHLHYTMASAVSGKIRLDASFERVGIAAQDVDADGLAAAQSVVVAAVPANSGDVDVAAITFSGGAPLDSIAAGELCRIRVERKPSDTTNDTATGDLELHAIEIQET
jgi:hypothetical protein